MRNLMLAVMFGFCATAVAQDLNTIPEAPDAPDVRDMPVVADLGGCILKPDGSVFTVYPAEVTLVGQWCDIALWKGPFSITEYPSFRVTLLRAPEDDGLVQLFARNIASSQNYKGPYIPFKKNQRVLEGEFAEYDDEEHSGGWFDDDPICTWFALQKTNKGDESQTYTITEVVPADADKLGGVEYTTSTVIASFMHVFQLMLKSRLLPIGFPSFWSMPIILRYSSLYQRDSKAKPQVMV